MDDEVRLEEEKQPEENMSEEAEGYDRSAREPRKRRKRREHRLWVRIVKKLAVFIGLIAIIGGTYFWGFSLKTVNVYGNSRYSDEEILNFVHYHEYPKNTLYFYWQNRHDITEGIPFIDRISVSIENPSTIGVSVEEKIIVGCVEDNGVYMFFDTDGIVLESSTERQQDVPLINGLHIENAGLNQKLPIEDETLCKTLLELTELLNRYGMSVSEIDYKEDQTLLMHYNDIKVALGTGKNLEDKMNVLKDLEVNLEGLKGTLHLENYNSTKDSIIFSKES